MEKNITSLVGYVHDLDKLYEVLQHWDELGLADHDDLYYVFGSTKVYVRGVTLDYCYKTVTGRTKEEHEKFVEERQRKFEESMATKWKEAGMQVSSKLERGKAVLAESQHDKWEDFVRSDARNGMLAGKLSGDVLEIIEAMSAGKSDAEIKSIVASQNHSGGGLHTLRDVLNEFIGPNRENIVKNTKKR